MPVRRQAPEVAGGWIALTILSAGVVSFAQIRFAFQAQKRYRFAVFLHASAASDSYTEGIEAGAVGKLCIPRSLEESLWRNAFTEHQAAVAMRFDGAGG
jgi:hypothetical protein